MVVRVELRDSVTLVLGVWKWWEWPVHADHHATSRAAKLMPMARAVRRSRAASARAVSLALLTSG